MKNSILNVIYSSVRLEIYWSIHVWINIMLSLNSTLISEIVFDLSEEMLWTFIYKTITGYFNEDKR